MNALQQGEKIVTNAEEFLYLWEVRSNTQWDDLRTKGVDQRAIDLGKLLKSVGHEDGWPYCMTFADGIWKMTYGPEYPPKISKMLTPSVMQSWHNVSDAGLGTRTPIPGAIMFMQMGNSGNGHAGIVKKIVGDSLYTIEANTSPARGTAEAEREGDGIFPKIRTLSFAPKSSGLHIKGFLNPIMI